MCPSTRSFRFRRTDGQAPTFKPGQFLQIHFDWEGDATIRSYSIATVPGASDEYELCIAYVEGGRASQYLWALAPGDVIDASGPYGRFILRDEEIGRYVLVATGTGVAPYRTMLPSLAARMAASDLQVELLLGVREPTDLLYGEEFRAFAAQHPRFRFHACYSRVLPEPHRPDERRAYVQNAFAELEPSPERDVFYLCGNPNMVDGAVEALTGVGFSPYAIRREKYVSG